MGFLLQARGRWNRYGEYGCLYTALSRDGAIAEYQKLLRLLGIDADEDRERDLVTLEVDVDPVLDLTDTTILKRLGLTSASLVEDTDEGFELCRTLADIARADGYSAIMSPSAAAPGEVNLTIYIDGRAGDLSLNVGPVREPLNY